jgi:TIR domain/Pentapeptide repeats (8 copies)
MANPEHLKILRQGVKVWNQWRQQNHEIKPDFSHTYLPNERLSDADLTRANLSHAYLVGANLNGAHLNGANLSGAYLNGAELISADFIAVRLFYTSFVDNDLSQVKGLEAVKHLGPSSIGIDTIHKSRGQVPEAFLRGCGVPDDFISYMRSLIESPIQFYSCFISYSSKDQDFANRLYADLQNKGVRCWFAPEDIKIGDKFRSRIDESIRIYDKLLLVLSEHSVSSQWVEKEVETAMEREREQNKTMLFPVQLDDAVNEMKVGWPADVRRTRHIGDFTRWKDHDSYQKAFDRLLRDLKAEEK